MDTESNLSTTANYTTMPEYKVINVASQNPNLPKSSSRYLYIVIFFVLAVLAVGFFLFFNSKNDQDDVVRNDLQEVKTMVSSTPVDLPKVVSVTFQDFLSRYFGSSECKFVNICGSEADPDVDGLPNQKEFDLGTDPNNPDSDLDMIGDGDEYNIFNLNPLVAKSKDSKKSDMEIVLEYNTFDKEIRKLTKEEIGEISKKIKEFGLHKPTLASLKEKLTAYSSGVLPTEEITMVATGTVLGETFDPADALNRDSQRLETIMKLGVAIEKYKMANSIYPEEFDIAGLFNVIKPFLSVATNIKDPVNAKPYVYDYKYNHPNDFTLTYYSETQNMPIRYTSKNSQKDHKKEELSGHDEQRKRDIEAIKTALLLYSTSRANAKTGQTDVFPKSSDLLKLLTPKFLGSLPKDPKSGHDYEYKVTSKLDKFTIKAKLDAPPSGYTGFFCNQEDECDYY